MPGLASQSQTIYNSLKNQDKDSTLSLLPSSTRRKMLIAFARKQNASIQDFTLSTKGGILDTDKLGLTKTGDIVVPHDLAIDYPEEEHFFWINDVKLKILPTDVDISMESMPLKDWVIRSEGMAKVKSGRAVIMVHISVPFIGQAEMNDSLRRIIAQARTLPIAYIDNQLVRQVVYPDNKSKSMAAVITSINIATHPDSQEVLIANISMEMFNYEPFSKEFLFTSFAVPASSTKPKNMNKHIKVKTPSDSLLFGQYYDYILDEGSDYSSGVTMPKELLFTSSAKKYRFKKVEEELQNKFVFKYNVYHPVPQAVLGPLKKIKIKNAVNAAAKKPTLPTKVVSTGKGRSGLSGAIIGLAAPDMKLFFTKNAGQLSGKKVNAVDVVKYALRKFPPGRTKYSQKRRMEDGFTDCSALVYRSIRDVGIGNVGSWTVSQVATLETLSSAGVTAFLRMPNGNLIPIPLAINGRISNNAPNISRFARIPGIILHSLKDADLKGHGVVFRPTHAGLTVGGGVGMSYRVLEALSPKSGIKILPYKAKSRTTKAWERGYFIPNAVYDYSANKEEFNELLGLREGSDGRVTVSLLKSNLQFLRDGGIAFAENIRAKKASPEELKKRLDETTRSILEAKKKLKDLNMFVLTDVNPQGATRLKAEKAIREWSDRLKTLEKRKTSLEGGKDTSFGSIISGGQVVSTVDIAPSASAIARVLKDTQVDLAKRAKEALKNWVESTERFRKIGEKKGWKMVWARSGTLMFAKEVKLVIDPESPYESAEGGTQVATPSQVTVSVNNIFARIPIIGKQYTTHQYLGSGDAEANISFTINGNGPIAQLQYMHKYCETASRKLRRVDNVGVIGVENDILNLVGMTDCIIDSVQISTLPEAPGLYSVQMKLTEWKRDQRERELLQPEFAIDIDTKRRYIEEIVRQFFVSANPRVIPGPSAGFAFGINTSFPAVRMDLGGGKEVTIRSLKKNGNRVSWGGDHTANVRVIDATHIAIAEIMQKFIRELAGLNVFHLLGWTEQQFIEATKDKSHPFYSFGLMQLIAKDLGGYKRPKSIKELFASKSQNLSFLTPDATTGVANREEYKVPALSMGSLFYRRMEAVSSSLIQSSASETLNRELKSRIQKFRSQNSSVIGKYKAGLKGISSSPAGTLMKKYGKARSMTATTISAGGVAGFFQGVLEFASDLNLAQGILNAVYGVQTDAGRLAKKTLGPGAASIVNHYPDIKATLFSKFDVRTQKTEVRTVSLRDEVRLEQLRLGVTLRNMFRALRDSIAAKTNQAQPQLSLHKDFKKFFQQQDKDSINYGGLPAYQDIPLPRVSIIDDHYSPKTLVKGKPTLQKHNDPPKTLRWLNPDFFFFNQDDERMTDLESIYKYESRVMKYVNASQELVYQFGMTPSKDSGSSSVTTKMGGSRNSKTAQGSPGLFAYLGGHLGPHSQSLGPKKSTYANRLPSSLADIMTPVSLQRTYKGAKGANGKVNLGVSDSGISQSTALARNYTSNEYKKLTDEDNPLKQGVHPLSGSQNSKIERVTFGPSGLSESRLPVMLDRSPESMISAFNKAFDSYKRNTYKMRRALPAFKLYFIEDDTGSILGSDKSSFIRSHDDFFSFSAVKEIKMISSRTVPADLVIITVSNLFGNLDDLQYSYSVFDKKDPLRPLDSDRRRESTSHYKADTTAENPFSRFILKEGVRVQLRLGYENDPSYLETEFNGQIIQINQVSASEIRIVCQSFATQLTAFQKGLGTKSIPDEWVDTFDLLSWAMCQPEMTYFGRWQLDQPKSLLESRSTGGWEKVFSILEDPRDDNIFVPDRSKMIRFAQDDEGGMWSHMLNSFAGLVNNANLGEKATWIRSVGDMDMYTLPVKGIYVWDHKINGKALLKAKNSIFPMVKENGQTIHFNTYGRGDSKILDYHVLRTSIWDIFKEMELRHPGWVARPLPYGNRMTMFFGQPSQLYWHRPMTTRELVNQNDILAKLREKIMSNDVLRAMNKTISDSRSPARAVLNKTPIGWAMNYPKVAITVGLAIFTAGIGAYIYGAGAAVAATGAAAAGETVGGTFLLLGARAAGVVARRALGTAAGATISLLKGGAVIYGAATAAAGVARVSGLLGPTAAQTLYATTVLAAANHYYAQKEFLQRISGRLIPFRRYHLVTSDNHIVANSIKASVHKTYNAISLEYTKDLATSNKDIGTPGTMFTKAMKASDRILDKDVRMGHESYPNCRGSWMADRYMQGLLMRYMKDTYKGQLLLLGDPRIRPYDRIIVMDDYTGMNGPIDVEQVVHTLTPASGFLTEVTPDFVIYGNNIVDMPYDDYMSAKMAFSEISYSEAIDNYLRFSNNVYRKKMVKTSSGQNADYLQNATGRRVVKGLIKTGTTVAAAAAVLLGGSVPLAIGALGVGAVAHSSVGPLTGFSSLFGSFGIKYYEWTTQRQPLLFQPLYVSDKPLLAGISMDKVGLIQNVNDKFVPMTANINAGFGVLKNAANDIGISTFGNLVKTLPLESSETVRETGD